MRRDNTKRTLFIGIIAALLVFGWWLRGFLYMNWHFGLFSPKSWRFLIHEFQLGWHIHTLGDWIFLISFIISIPLFIWVWYIMVHINWTKLYHRIIRWIKKIYKTTIKAINLMIWPFLSKKRKRLKKIKKAQANKKPTVIQRVVTPQRPVAMPSTHQGTRPIQPMNPMPMMYTPTNNAPFAVQPSPYSPQPPMADLTPELNANNPPPFDFQQMAQTPLSEIKLPEIEPVTEDISTILTTMGYTLLPNGTFAQHTTDYLAVSEKQLLVISTDSTTGDWLADEEAFNDEDPLWFSETDHRVSPIFTLIQQAKEIIKTLQENQITLSVQPVYITTKANIINAEDMMKTWRDLGVQVCRTQVGGPVQLPTAGEIFKDKQNTCDANIAQRIISILSLKETSNG